MAATLTPDELRTVLRDGQPLSDPFQVLRSIGAHITFAPDPRSANVARDLVILMLGRREELNGYSEIVDSLAMCVGLYPYADPTVLNLPQLLEYEAHRPDGLQD